MKTVKLIEENGELVLPLDEEMMECLGAEPGDTIEWTDNGDGSWTMSKKKETEIVLVECISSFRMLYAVEVPKGNKAWALDTVTMQEAEEVGQEHIGETIVSHRVVDKQEYIRVFDEINNYLESWNDEDKMKYIKKV
jgi:hypothetical protein